MGYLSKNILVALRSITKLSNRKRLLLFALTAANSTKLTVVSNYLTTTATTITIRGHLAVHSAYLWHTVLTLTTNPIPGLAKFNQLVSGPWFTYSQQQQQQQQPQPRWQQQQQQPAIIQINVC